jgi:hypothetical protein
LEGVGSEGIGSIGSSVVSPLTPQPELEEGVGEGSEAPIALEEAGVGEGAEAEIEEGLEPEEAEEAEELEVEAEAEEEVEAPRMEEPTVEYTGPICEECIHWAALKCAKHPDWIVVTPTARYARNCQYFAPKEVASRVKQGAAL